MLDRRLGPHVQSSLDEDTLSRFRAGDPLATEAVVRAYHARLIGFLQLYTRDRGLAEDLAQEVFIVTVRHRERIRGVSELQAWLFTLARREALRELKRKRHTAEVSMELDDIVELGGAKEGGQQRLLAEEGLKEVLAKGLAELKPRDREILVLRFFYELQIKEIAEVLAIPIGSVGVFLKRALDRLRQVLESQGHRFEDLNP